MFPKTPQEYRDRADECERMASRALDDSGREMLRDAASCWRTIADADECIAATSLGLNVLTDFTRAAREGARQRSDGASASPPLRID